MITQTVSRVAVTPAAADVIAKVRAKHGPLLFHQSGDCWDGSSPVCYVVGDFMLGASDIWVGQIEGCDFWMTEDQFYYWRYTHLTIDVMSALDTSFSLEIPMGIRFLTRSRLFKDRELEHLMSIPIRR